MRNATPAPRWDSDLIFPENLYEGLVLVQADHVVADAERIEKKVKGWTPFSSFLIGDGGSRLLPAVCVSSVSQVAKRNYMLKYGMSVALFLFAACLVYVVSSSEEDKGISGLSLLLAMYLIFDYLVLCKGRALEDRARFIYWVRNDLHVRSVFIHAVLISLMLGVIQWALAYWSGSITGAIERFGLVFEHALSGDWWRFFVGAYLHASYAHFLGNASLFAPLFAISYGLCGRRAVYSFVMANLLVPVLSIPWVMGEFDAYAGVSSGIFSLFGLLSIHVAANRGKYPLGIVINILMLALVSLLASSFFNKNSLLVSHAFGFLFGCGFGAFFEVRRSIDEG
ncbi:MAG: rhomboid family intramembrane serine protease [Gammaproteobacteria bacterium]